MIVLIIYTVNKKCISTTKIIIYSEQHFFILYYFFFFFLRKVVPGKLGALIILLPTVDTFSTYTEEYNIIS